MGKTVILSTCCLFLVLLLAPGLRGQAAVGDACDDSTDPPKPCVDTAVCVDDLCKSKVGQTCSDDADCFTNAVCDTTCQCAEGYTPNQENTECRLRGQAAVGEACDDSKDPAKTCEDTAVCVDDLCKSKVGQTCSNDADCFTNAVCDTTCQCAEGYTPNQENTECSGVAIVTFSWLALAVVFVAARCF